MISAADIIARQDIRVRMCLKVTGIRISLPIQLFMKYWTVSLLHKAPPMSRVINFHQLYPVEDWQLGDVPPGRLYKNHLRGALAGTLFVVGFRAVEKLSIRASRLAG
jgi:hypothetical protein